MAERQLLVFWKEAEREELVGWSVTITAAVPSVRLMTWCMLHIGMASDPHMAALTQILGMH